MRLFFSEYGLVISTLIGTAAMLFFLVFLFASKDSSIGAQFFRNAWKNGDVHSLFAVSEDYDKVYDPYFETSRTEWTLDDNFAGLDAKTERVVTRNMLLDGVTGFYNGEVSDDIIMNVTVYELLVAGEEINSPSGAVQMHDVHATDKFGHLLWKDKEETIPIWESRPEYKARPEDNVREGDSDIYGEYFPSYTYNGGDTDTAHAKANGGIVLSPNSFYKIKVVYRLTPKENSSTTSSNIVKNKTGDIPLYGLKAELTEVWTLGTYPKRTTMGDAYDYSEDIYESVFEKKGESLDVDDEALEPVVLSLIEDLVEYEMPEGYLERNSEVPNNKEIIKILDRDKKDDVEKEDKEKEDKEDNESDDKSDETLKDDDSEKKEDENDSDKDSEDDNTEEDDESNKEDASKGDDADNDGEEVEELELTIEQAS